MPNEYHSLWSAVSGQWHDLAVTTTVGLVSGIAAFLHRFKNRQPRLFSIVEFVADTLLSAFAANIAFYLCMWWTEAVSPLSWWAIAAIVGIVAHKAARWLFLIDRMLMRRAKLKLEIDDDGQD